MSKRRRIDLDVIIDESTHTPVPTYFKRFKNAILAVFMGILFAQVILFAFMYGSIVLYWDNPLFILHLIFCAIMGWIAGEKFIQTLSIKSEEWWIWNFWNLK
jgi:hypothetical protein